MFRRKLIAGVAALTAAASIAIPAASASAQPTYSYTPPYFFCAGLIPQIDFATAAGNTVWASALSNVFVYSHCGGAAI